MRKRILVLSSVLIIFGLVSIYILNETTTAELANTIKVSKKQGDFTVHIRAEKNDKGFQILRSIEYQGEEPITIEHRTPLTAVSISRENANFTGSPVSKTLNPGDIYHPQQPLIYKPLDRGEHVLFIHTQFFIDGQRQPVDIKTSESITFE